MTNSATDGPRAHTGEVCPIDRLFQKRAAIEESWARFQAAIIVSWNVPTPEVQAEVKAAKAAMLKLLGEPDSS